MTDQPIDFFFTMGSTYTYLSVNRVPEVAAKTRVAFRWRPFHLGVLFKEMGYMPFSGKPAKSAHMWRDIERRAAARGLPARVPAPYPLRNTARANLVATVGLREGWGIDYIRAAYRRWFAHGQPSDGEENMRASLAELGLDMTRVLALAESEDVNAQVLAETDRARALGLFGSPTFVVDGELFWGDDRLEDAVDWRREGRVLPR